MCVSFAHLMLAFIEISLVYAPLVGIKLFMPKGLKSSFVSEKLRLFSYQKHTSTPCLSYGRQHTKANVG